MPLFSVTYSISPFFHNSCQIVKRVDTCLHRQLYISLCHFTSVLQFIEHAQVPDEKLPHYILAWLIFITNHIIRTVFYSNTKVIRTNTFNCGRMQLFFFKFMLHSIDSIWHILVNIFNWIKFYLAWMNKAYYIHHNPLRHISTIICFAMRIRNMSKIDAYVM